jgi:C-5 cytosine-specific DNA methylase
MSKPLCIDLFSGVGGATEGFLLEGYDCVGFDIERHVYGEHQYPAQLVIQDILTLHGSQFKDASFIWASPPCQTYSWMAMPWSLAKAKAAAIRADTTGQALAGLNRLFDACFRIQKEASIAAHRHIPMVVENVRGAIPWVGRSRWNFGSFHLWGDVPALMPITSQYGQGPGVKRPGRTMCYPAGSANPEAVSGRNGKLRWQDDSGMSKSSGRKMASAMIAKIPLPLSRHIAATYRP